MTQTTEENKDTTQSTPPKARKMGLRLDEVIEIKKFTGHGFDKVTCLEIVTSTGSFIVNCYPIREILTLGSDKMVDIIPIVFRDMGSKEAVQPPIQPPVYTIQTPIQTPKKTLKQRLKEDILILTNAMRETFIAHSDVLLVLNCNNYWASKVFDIVVNSHRCIWRTFKYKRQAKVV